MYSIKSNRHFQTWEYQVSHGQLLIRSPKAPATPDLPEFTTNVDLVCIGVEYLAIPRLFKGLEVTTPTDEEKEHLEILLGKPLATDNIRILVSQGQRFSIVALSIALVENDWDIFESPFEFRSTYKG